MAIKSSIIISLLVLFILLINIIGIMVYFYIKKNKNNSKSEEILVTTTSKKGYYNILMGNNSKTLLIIILSFMFIALFISLSDNNKMKAIALASPLMAVTIDKAKCVLKDYLDSVDFSKLTNSKKEEETQLEANTTGIVISSNNDKINNLEVDIFNYHNDWNNFLEYLIIEGDNNINIQEKKIHLQMRYDKINEKIIELDKENHKKYFHKQMKEINKYNDFYIKFLDIIILLDKKNNNEELELFINQNSDIINSRIKLIDIFDKIMNKHII